MMDPAKLENSAGVNVCHSASLLLIVGILAGSLGCIFIQAVQGTLLVCGICRAPTDEATLKAQSEELEAVAQDATRDATRGEDSSKQSRVAVAAKIR